MKENTNDLRRTKTLLVPIVKRIVRHKDVKAKLAQGKARRKELNRPDFVWHELLLSFALFKKGVEKPLIDTAVNASSAATPTQSIVDVVPKEAEQVHKAFPQK